MHRLIAAAFCVLCAILLFLPQRAAAQEYYGVPIEDGGVAFLIDVSGSMDNRSEKLKVAADSLLRGLAGAVKGTPLEQSKIGQALARRAARGTSLPVSKMNAARNELMHALDSLAPGTNFTIITFGDRASEWPGGVRSASPSATALARDYVANLSASGGTPMAEALQLGFQSPNVRTLFVVSDGIPTTGEVLGLVRQLQESREGRRMVINTVGIGADQDRALLCQLALDNEGVYMRDGAIACTFSPCAPGDGVVTFYPPAPQHKAPRVTPVCSSAEHPDCTPKLVYETMLSDARYQTPTSGRAKVTHCLELEDPAPVTIVINPEGLEAIDYTRPGNPSHPRKVTRIVRQRGDEVVVESALAGKGGSDGFEAVDDRLIRAVQQRLEPQKPNPDSLWKNLPKKPSKDR